MSVLVLWKCFKNIFQHIPSSWEENSSVSPDFEWKTKGSKSCKGCAHIRIWSSKITISVPRPLLLLGWSPNSGYLFYSRAESIGTISAALRLSISEFFNCLGLIRLRLVPKGCTQILIWSSKIIIILPEPLLLLGWPPNSGYLFYSRAESIETVSAALRLSISEIFNSLGWIRLRLVPKGCAQILIWSSKITISLPRPLLLLGWSPNSDYLFYSRAESIETVSAALRLSIFENFNSLGWTRLRLVPKGCAQILIWSSEIIIILPELFLLLGWPSNSAYLFYSRAGSTETVSAVLGLSISEIYNSWDWSVSDWY